MLQNSGVNDCLRCGTHRPHRCWDSSLSWMHAQLDSDQVTDLAFAEPGRTCKKQKKNKQNYGGWEENNIPGE